MFPILMSDEEWEEINAYKLYAFKLPKKLPIEFVKQYEVRIKVDYNKSVEEIAEQGGLHPRELVAAMYDMSLRTYFGKMEKELSREQTIFACNMIMMKWYDFKKKKKEVIL